MFGTTMLLTVGHALDRAMEDGLVVRLNAGGEWITGTVLNHDGHGVAMLESNGGLCVLRQEAITCVRLPFTESGPRVPQQTEYVTPAPSRPEGQP
jgi:hypothetical protein